MDINEIYRSPDFNALDLGAWRSLAAGVPTIKGKDKSKRLIDCIVFHVLDQWNNWDALHRLTNIFSTKARIMQAVSAVNGSNEYEIPRSNISHAKESATYVLPKLQVEESEDKEEGESDGKEEESDDNDGDDDNSEIEFDMEESTREYVNQFTARVSNSNKVLDWWNQRRIQYEE